MPPPASSMDVSDFDFHLPRELIAQEPARDRGAARLLHLPRAGGLIEHLTVTSLPALLGRGDVLVVNNTRVFPARLMGRRVPSGGTVECLLLSRLPESEEREWLGCAPTDSEQVWEALMHPGQKLMPGALAEFDGTSLERSLLVGVPRPSEARSGALHVEVLDRRFHGRRAVRVWTDDGDPVSARVDAIGQVPLPPYIHRAATPDDSGRYQTVFARHRGSVAAPTAGLHFSDALLGALREEGVELVEITLHVGYGTFQPVRVTRVEDHTLAAERYTIAPAAADALNRALGDGRRIVAVGTTSTRTLEAAALAHGGRVEPGCGATDLFIHPGFRFQVVGGLIDRKSVV